MPSLPFISIITPTYNRERFLPAIARCVQRQRVNWEWLVLDDSPEPSQWMKALGSSDPRVHYMHSSERLSIGAKRNHLLKQAHGDVIAHFDDDDHYASSYLSDMIGLLQSHDADLVKLSTFFMYSPSVPFLGYMDLNARLGQHFVLTHGEISTVEFHTKMKIGTDFILFYGFSYVYRRAMLDISRFDDVDLCDDESFIRRIVDTGHKVIAASDEGRTCLHVVHPCSTSRCFSRHSIPTFLLPQLFPEYEGYPG